MKISIITVCFNSAEFIRTAIESVLTQTYEDIEYIIIDGASTDCTLDIINEYSNKIHHLVSEPDQGIYDAMNKGISVASGDVIGILNSDDFYLNSHVIAEVIATFQQYQNVDMVLANVDFVRPLNLFKPVRFYSSNSFSPWQLKYGFMPAHPGSFMKKAAYDHVGPYKLDYKSGADFDMFVRLFKMHYMNYVKLNLTVVRMRIGGVSTSGLRSYVTSTKEILKSLNENGIYSNVILLSIRFPIKFFQMMLFKVRCFKCKSY